MCVKKSGAQMIVLDGQKAPTLGSRRGGVDLAIVWALELAPKGVGVVLAAHVSVASGRSAHGL